MRNPFKYFKRGCQTKTDRSRKTGIEPNSGRELTPCGQGLSTVFLEFFTAIEMAFEIEVVENRGLDGGELLETSHRPEPRHDFLSSSQRLM
jgi:hypothetical protein